MQVRVPALHHRMRARPHQMVEALHGGLSVPLQLEVIECVCVPPPDVLGPKHARRRLLVDVLLPLARVAGGASRGAAVLLRV
jgi:hypothetical protein